MAVSDLTNTTWYFNRYFRNIPSSSLTYNINFTSNNNSYTSLYLNMINYNYGHYTLNYNSTQVYYCNDDLGEDSWTDEIYRTFTITGGTDVTNASLIAFLELNATQQSGSTAKTQVGTSTIAKKMFGTTPIAKEVVNGVTVYEASTPSGYSVTVSPDVEPSGMDSLMFLKFNTAPTSSSDYDVKCDYGVLYDRNGAELSVYYTVSNITKLYIWTDNADGSYTLNDNHVYVVSQSYSTANEETLTQNSTLDLISTYED